MKRRRLSIEDMAAQRAARIDERLEKCGFYEAIEKANAQGKFSVELDVPGISEAQWDASGIKADLAAQGFRMEYFPAGEYGYDMSGSPRMRCAGINIEWGKLA